MTYKIHIPDEIERALRARAAAENKSLEEAIVDGLARDLGMCTSPDKRDTTDAAETTEDDRDVQAVLREQRMIDWDAWFDGIKRRDLSGIAGQRLITPEMKAVFAEQRRIDPQLWQ